MVHGVTSFEYFISQYILQYHLNKLNITMTTANVQYRQEQVQARNMFSYSNGTHKH